jgi:hypothetical protein
VYGWTLKVIQDLFSGRGERFSVLFTVPTGSGAHPAPTAVDTGGTVPEVEGPEL